MARKNPLGRLVETAADALRNPKEAAEKVVHQAKGTAALGKMVAEHVGRTAAEKAGATRGRRTSAPATAPAPTPTSPADLRPVPSVNEPAPAPAPAKKAPAKKAAAKKAPAKKAAAKKAPAKKAAAKKAPAKKTAASPGDKLPAGRAKRDRADPEVAVTREDREAAKKASPADVAKNVEPGR